MSSAEHEPSALWSRLSQARAGLRALSFEARARLIAEVASVLARPDDALLARLAASSGLSLPNVRFGLTTTFGAFDEASLRALGQAQTREAYDAIALVLAGNVFTACARPMLLALLAGAPILAKASSDDAALPLAIAAVLSAHAPALGAACGVVAFGREDARRTRALLDGAQSVQVLGSDEAVAAIAAQCTPAQRVVGRGHGLGVGLVRHSELRDAASAERAARALALDVAAYDQRGCLSPQVIFVERGGNLGAPQLARLLYTALEAHEETLPRGALPPDAAAEQMQWRGLASARGELHAHARFAVSCEHAEAPRPSPGYRNVGVYGLPLGGDLRAQLGPLARFVKALGVAGDAREYVQLAPYVCAAGAMQTPPLDAPLDGLSPLEGFVR